MSLSFHQTFRLELSNVERLIASIREQPTLDNVGISEATGIGIGKDPNHGKVQPTIDYATYGGLIEAHPTEEGQQISLTDIGELVIENDRRLRKRVSHWVIHYHLSRPGSEAEAWTFFVHHFLPQFEPPNGSFRRFQLSSAIKHEFGGRASVKTVNPGLLTSCYTDESNALGKLRLVREKDKNEFVHSQPNIPNAFVAAYILADMWERRHPTSSTVSVSTLLQPGHLATTLGVDNTILQQLLDRMTAEKLIDQMRSVSPFQVVRGWDDKLELLQAAYDAESLF